MGYVYRAEFKEWWKACCLRWECWYLRWIVGGLSIIDGVSIRITPKITRDGELK